MPENLLYEYAVIRIVPRVERGEYINAGIILFCRDAKFLGMKFELNSKKLLALNENADLEKISDLLNAFQKICYGLNGSGSIGRMADADRFRWLSAKRSTILQVSEVHPGFCKDPGAELEKLFRNLVLL